MTDKQQHWETVYRTKAADAVSWYRPHLDASLALIGRIAPDHATAVLDVGGGASTLVDDLLARGYRDLSVLDISTEALGVAQTRLGAAADAVTWLAADLLDAPLQKARYDLWHDRALFHFLTSAEHRARYVRQLIHALKPGGHVLIATFAPQGPQQCSGLDVARYDAASLLQALGPAFESVDNMHELHHTPSGVMQPFTYCHCRLA